MNKQQQITTKNIKNTSSKSKKLHDRQRPQWLSLAQSIKPGNKQQQQQQQQQQENNNKQKPGRARPTNTKRAGNVKENKGNNDKQHLFVYCCFHVGSSVCCLFVACCLFPLFSIIVCLLLFPC
ncbi:unnamed protein product [Polarella glacialis]|uniref:Uncharacterized protein n=1 Tax=Polarella glacialis TaxID=89957 RepID=A0A813JSK6_POLGL|nr:unnamed protein product [Polarella glacialis]